MDREIQLLYGSEGHEHVMPAYVESPTWVLDDAWDAVWQVARSALDAYMSFCVENGYPHSYLLGLDILIMGELDPDDPTRVVDIRPTIVEGPCCNSFPAAPVLWGHRLYKQLVARGLDPDCVEYPTHPLRAYDKLAETFLALWRARGGTGLPRIGVFTRAYAESEEEDAHKIVIEHLRGWGMEVHRITPEERPEVRGGRIWVHGVPIDIGYRRIERIHVPVFYGLELGRRIVEETPETLWVNPWEVDDWRSKTIEERAFRRWESRTGGVVSRPRTLLGPEITPESVADLARRGGYVLKRWNSTGGKGVLLHLNLERARHAADRLYLRYDGRHMVLLDRESLERDLRSFNHFSEDASIQQLRLIDARPLDEQTRIAYDTRINVVYDEQRGQWEFLAGISRSVACGPQVTKGNSLLTNITSGAEVAPLVTGRRKPNAETPQARFGPLLAALMQGRSEITL